MLSSTKTEFGVKCREFRKARHLKLRQVAEAVGVAPSTYGNVESSQWRVIGRERAVALAEFFKLPDLDRDAFLAAWEATPLSKFSEERRERWRKQNENRKLSALVPKLRYALCLVLGVHIGAVEADKICVCEFGGQACEVCEALVLLGLDAYTTREAMIDQLGGLQDKLEAARAAAQKPAAP